MISHIFLFFLYNIALQLQKLHNNLFPFIKTNNINNFIKSHSAFYQLQNNFISIFSRLLIIIITQQFHSNLTASPMNEQQLQQVYEMVDSIPLSRPKKNISRDFSDAVMMAELISHYKPKLVELHNYPPSNAVNKKIQNWNTLNSKVLKKLGIYLSKQNIQDIANAAPNIIEMVLYQILVRFEKPQEQGTLTENAKKINNRTQKKKNERDEDVRSNNGDIQDLQYNAVMTGQISHQNYTMEGQLILRLVEQVDNATAELARVKQISRAKDEIIRNLQKSLQKIIYS